MAIDRFDTNTFCFTPSIFAASFVSSIATTFFQILSFFRRHILWKLLRFVPHIIYFLKFEFLNPHSKVRSFERTFESNLGRLGPNLNYS